MKRTSIIILLLSALVMKAEDGWTLHAEGECPEYTGAAAANGTLGILHWKEPFSIRQIILNNVFELNDDTQVNCAVLSINPFVLGMTVDGKDACTGYTEWSQSIDMRKAEHRTEFKAAGKVKVSYSLTALRNLPHSAMLLIHLQAEAPAEIRFSKSHSVPSGYAGPRHSHKEFYADGKHIRVQQTSARTIHGRHDISATSMFIFDEAKGRYSVRDYTASIDFHLEEGEKITLAVIGSICTTAEYSDPYSEARRELVYIDRIGTERVLQGHRKMWEELWDSDIIISGDILAQRTVRFALYNLYSSCREDTGLSIPPMGLSSQGYNGHIFWDTELWMYPPMLLLNQAIARSMLDYRYDRLEPARRRASDYGYRGAMFPWESDSDGQESTPAWALTGPMEHHVTADVGIAAWNYFCVTKDVDWLQSEGMELLKEVADFWVSRVTENDDGTYSIAGVVGADEYAQDVTDNAFTNGAVKTVLKNAVKAASICGRKAPKEWKRIAKGLRILKSQDGHTLEYEGYTGDMIKQADANLLAYPLKIVTEPEQMAADLQYYEDRIDPVNGPAMSFSIFAIQYARLGLSGKATEMFNRAYEPNIRPPFGVFAETPTSDNPYFMTGAGGLLQAVIFGFGGLAITDKGIVQHTPLLPEGWKSLTLKGIGPDKKTYIIGPRAD